MGRTTRAGGTADPSAPGGDRLHLGWRRLRAALRGAGVAPGLLGPSLRIWLGARGRLAPSQDEMLRLLDEHLTRGGRLAEGRYLACRQGDGVSARTLVRRLAAAAPELGPLALADERQGGRGRLVLRTVGVYAVIPDEDLELEELGGLGARYARRTVSVDTVVEATNVLLAARGLSYRFLPLATPPDVAAYLGTDRRGARMLDEVELWDGPLDELDDFAVWLPEGRVLPATDAA